MNRKLQAGAVAVEITPQGSVFLMGYPHVRRFSTGVHDPLWASALALDDGQAKTLFIACDIIYIPKAMGGRARERIAERCAIPAQNILISATHTHSGPKMLDPLATSHDTIVARADLRQVARIEDGIVEAGVKAIRNLQPAEIGLAVADATGVGTNRRDPAGPRDLDVPVLLVRDAAHRPLAAMLACSMHPTVLHEDSTLISGDFPGLARQILQKELLGPGCPVLYHTGPAGNQSPRHVTRENTFAEAERLGRILASAAMKVIPSIRYGSDVALACRSAPVDLPRRAFPSVIEAQERLDSARARLEQLRKEKAPRTQIRTAEVDWFGAEETLTLARAAASGAVDAAAATCMPAEVQAIRVGEWNFVAWPGEMFVEFALEVKRQSPNTFLIAYANGELQGYLVTQAAADEAGYESQHAIFASPASGERLVAAALQLLKAPG